MSDATDLDYHRSRAAYHAAIVTAMEDGTHEAVTVSEWVTARQVADALGISAQGANNRLVRLVSCRVVRRRRIGLHFEYAWGGAGDE